LIDVHNHINKETENYAFGFISGAALTLGMALIILISFSLGRCSAETKKLDTDPKQTLTIQSKEDCVPKYYWIMNMWVPFYNCEDPK
jgi:hypothetical protein